MVTLHPHTLTHTHFSLSLFAKTIGFNSRHSSEELNRFLCPLRTQHIEFVQRRENNAVCCPMSHRHFNASKHKNYERNWECNAERLQRENPKQEGLWMCGDSQQFMSGKPDGIKRSESKPQSGLMLVFSSFLTYSQLWPKLCNKWAILELMQRVLKEIRAFGNSSMTKKF